MNENEKNRENHFERENKEYRQESWKNLGDKLTKGELYGMIKFGSCTELYIPGDFEICVKKGDKVKGGLTVVGRLK